MEMSLWQAIVLGVVEGLTEYLPVSSTGHLVLTQRALGITQTPAADAYAICIQAGAIVAVLGMYHHYIAMMLRGIVGRDRNGLRLLINICVAFAPAAVIGLFLLEPLTKNLFGLWPIVSAWFVGGVAILLVAWKRPTRLPGSGHEIFDLTWKRALLIGLFQCIALWPGTSRSLVTIVAGVLVGLNLKDAVIFSFLLGAITLGAGTAHEALFHGPEMVNAYGASGLAAGFIAAAASAAVAVRWMVNYLKQHGLALFGYYRVGLAVLVAALLSTGVLSGP